MGLLNLFRRKTDREKYDTASKKFGETWEALKTTKNNFYRKKDKIQDYYEGLSNVEMVENAEANYNRAKRNLNEIYEESHGEAIKLNKKYDALIKKLVDDAQEIHEFERDKLGMHKKRDNSGLVAITSILGIVAGIFFLSPNLTGNVIGNMTNSTSNIIGVTLLIVGLIGSFFWFRSRR